MEKLPLHEALALSASTRSILDLLENNSSDCWKTDIHGCLPLHVACSHQAPPEVISKLIDVHAVAINVFDSQGYLPIHIACRHRLSMESMRELCSRDIPQVSKRSRSGALPVHFAVQYRQCVEVVTYLLTLDPTGRFESWSGKKPLHLACEARAEMDVVRSILRENESLAAEKSTNGMMPLHFCASNKADVALMRYIVSLCPDALLEKDRLNRIPLHYALERHAPMDATLFLLSECPSSAGVRGHGGNFPLHIALEKSIYPTIISELLQVFPEACSERDMLGLFPLVKSITNGLPGEVILKILRSCPSVAVETDDFQRISLHYAVSRSCELNVIQALLEAYPDGVRRPDKNGQLPLHLAVKRLSSADIVEALLTAYPEALMSRDAYDLSPFHHALEVEGSLQMVKHLIRWNNECVRDRFDGVLPLHLAIEFKRFDIVPAILHTDPTGASDQQSMKRRLPIQAAIVARAPLHILLALQNASVTASGSLTDEDGLSAVHYAIMFHEPVELIALLVESNPSIVFEQNLWMYYRTPVFPPFTSKRLVARKNKSKDEHFEMDPLSDRVDVVVSSRKELTRQPGKESGYVNVRMLLHFCTEIAGSSFEVVAFVLKYTMPITVDGTPNPRHNYNWCYVMAHTEDKYWNAVEKVLEEFDRSESTELIQILSDSPDEVGRKIIDIATVRCQRCLLRRLYFFVRYQLKSGRSEHLSSSSMIQLAHDHDDKKRLVALKFMKSRVHFEREVHGRVNYGLSGDCVIEMLRSHDGDADPIYREELVRKGLISYPYLIVMAAADITLTMSILHENYFAGRDWSQIRLIASQIATALSHIHSKGLIHGDIKPLNIMRESNRMKFIDLGSCTSFGSNEVVSVGDVNGRVSTAYLPPELFTAHRSVSAFSGVIGGSQGSASPSRRGQSQKSSRKAVSSPPRESSSADSPTTRGRPQSPLVFRDSQALLCVKTGLAFHEKTELAHVDDVHKSLHIEGDRAAVPEITQAHPSIDLWSLGVVLYYMCAGETLFHGSVDDTIDNLQLTMLADWNDELKEQRLSRISDAAARHLVSQLLSFQPHRRPSADQVLRHPFITNRSPARYPGLPAEFDVCIIARLTPREELSGTQAESSAAAICVELIHAMWLARLLRSRGLKVSLADERGVNLIKSRSALVLLSRTAINSPGTDITSLDKDSVLDQYLALVRLALELPRFGILENGIFCLQVGDRSDCSALDSEDLKSLASADSKSSKFSVLRSLRNFFDYQIREEDEEFFSVHPTAVESLREGPALAPANKVTIRSYFEHFGGEVLGRFGGCHPRSIPNTHVTSVESFVSTVLQQECLGVPFYNLLTVDDMIKRVVTSSPWGVHGDATTAWSDAAEFVCKTLSGEIEQHEPGPTRTLSTRSLSPDLAAGTSPSYESPSVVKSKSLKWDRSLRSSPPRSLNPGSQSVKLSSPS